MNIRLATYNIHKFVGRDGRRDESRILDIIKAMNADILALQEFVLADHSENNALVEAFASKAGYKFIAQPMLRKNDMVQYNLLLSRVPARTHALVELPRDGTEPRSVINAGFEFHGKGIQIAATHLGLSAKARKQQLAMLFESQTSQDETPFALLGDLNIVFPWEPARRHLNRKFFGQKQAASFPARFPILAFDSIYHHPKEMIRSLRSFSEKTAHQASDHLPVIADIALA